MLRYVVIADVPAARAVEWREWMCQRHIPDVLATGCFERAALWQDSTAEDPAVFVVEYWCSDMDAFQRYLAHHAPALRQEHAERFGTEVRLRRFCLALCCRAEPPVVPTP